MARARARRCCCPPERVTPRSPTSVSSQAGAPRGPLHGARAEDARQAVVVALAAHEDVVGERARQRERALRHDAEALRAADAPRRQERLAPRRGEERGLAGADGADEGDELPGAIEKLAETTASTDASAGVTDAALAGAAVVVVAL